MEYNLVVDTAILSREEVQSGGGRRYAVLEVAYADFTYVPGQFIMLHNRAEGFFWSYPYLVQSATRKGFNIAVTPDSDIFLAGPGHPVTVWGALGKGVSDDRPLVVVTEPALLHLATPLLAQEGTRLLVIGATDAPALGGAQRETAFPASAAQAAEQIGEGVRVAAAFNLPTLLEFMEYLPGNAHTSALVYASVKIGCGIGACRGCYLHDPAVRAGVAVCCVGPYMPYANIDFETDRKCFQHFA